ncbi:MAG: 5-(carboxyamino)imidazole ribonucleotide synthase [Pyrinomonadaceae bacterium]
MIEPGSTIGIFGSGQLGRMFAMEAARMGYKVVTYSPHEISPAGRFASAEIVADYKDLLRVEEFARSVDVVTFEFENIPIETIEAAAGFVDVHPNGEILHTTQNRLREKAFLSKNGFPQAVFKHVQTKEDLINATQELGFPGVLKTVGFGYDGKGQQLIKSLEDIEVAFATGDLRECVFEEFVDFEKEVSVVCARDEKGNFADYGVIENQHSKHILDISFAPGIVSDAVRIEAFEIARGIAEKFGYVGVLCVEFFVQQNNRLLVNEIAPRPHNSGHVTFETSCITSQFEQQLRAICGIPLGSTEFLQPASIANLLGDIWLENSPRWNEALKESSVKLHLYGKREARASRKMGHLSAIGKTSEDARKIVKAARAAAIQT